MPYHFKIVNAGDGGVGKTTFLKRYTIGQFVEDSKETIGTGFFTKTLYDETKNRKERIDLTIWDFGGQKRFRHIIKDFVMGAAGALLFFDLTRYESFEHLEDWIRILRANETGEKELPIILVGSKLDLTDLIVVKDDEIADFVEKHDLIGYISTSAKTGDNVANAVKILVEYIFEKNKGVF